MQAGCRVFFVSRLQTTVTCCGGLEVGRRLSQTTHHSSDDAADDNDDGNGNKHARYNHKELVE